MFIRILNWRGKCCKGHWGDKRRHLNKRRGLDTDTAPALNSHSGDRTGYVRACPSSQEMSSEVRRTLPLACYSSVTWRLKTATIYCVSRSCGVTGLSQAALLLVRSWLELLTWLHSFSRELGWAGSPHTASVPCLGRLSLTLSTRSLPIHDEAELFTWVSGGLPSV